MEGAPPAAATQLPWTVRAAAIILAAYGLVVLLNAALEQNAIGWGNIEPRGFPRAVIRFLGMSLIAWGLWKRARWAWWGGVLLPGFFVVTGVAALAVYFRLRADAPDVPPLPSMPLVLASFVALTVAVVLLLTPMSRGAFKRTAA